MSVLVETVCMLTGMGLVRLLSRGQWRSEKLTGKEAAIQSAAGSLSFRIDGSRVVTTSGLILVGMAFYGVLAWAGIWLATRG